MLIKKNKIPGIACRVAASSNKAMHTDRQGRAGSRAPQPCREFGVYHRPIHHPLPAGDSRVRP